MTDRIYFDNFIITNDENVASQFATDTWAVKRDLEASNSKSTVSFRVRASLKHPNDLDLDLSFR